MKRLLLPCIALAWIAALATSHAKPNIVILFSDDAGCAEFGFQDKADPGLAKPTPWLTRLAREGVIFSHGDVSGDRALPTAPGKAAGRTLVVGPSCEAGAGCGGLAAVAAQSVWQDGAATLVS